MTKYQLSALVLLLALALIMASCSGNTVSDLTDK